MVTPTGLPLFDWAEAMRKHVAKAQDPRRYSWGYRIRSKLQPWLLWQASAGNHLGYWVREELQNYTVWSPADRIGYMLPLTGSWELIRVAPDRNKASGVGVFTEN